MPEIHRGLGWVVLAIAAVGALAGCGDLSLYDALESDSPGGLRFSPSAALVPENTAFTFSVLGGFLPYDIAVGAAIIPKDDHTWEFPPTIVTSGESQVFTLTATDLLGKVATAEVTVYKLPPLVLSVQNVTLLEGDSWTFSVTGGKSPYAWFLDNTPQGAGGSYVFPATAAGSYTVSVTDTIGVARAALVQVVPAPPPGSPLAIMPASVTVLVGHTVIFTAMGGSGSYTFSASGGAITPEPDGNPATYVAGTKGSQTVSVGAGSETANAAVTVVTSPVQALALSPDSPTVSAVDDTIEFAASGGTAPYGFSTDHPAWGSISATGAFTGLYTQLEANRNVMVRVTDANGTSVSTMVKWK